MSHCACLNRGERACHERVGPHGMCTACGRARLGSGTCQSSWKQKSFHNRRCLYGCAGVLLWPGLHIFVTGNYLHFKKKKYNVIFALIWIHEMDFVTFPVVRSGHSCLQINTAVLASTSPSPTALVNCTSKSVFSVLKCAF